VIDIATENWRDYRIVHFGHIGCASRHLRLSPRRLHRQRWTADCPNLSTSISRGSVGQSHRRTTTWRNQSSPWRAGNSSTSSTTFALGRFHAGHAHHVAKRPDEVGTVAMPRKRCRRCRRNCQRRQVPPVPCRDGAKLSAASGCIEANDSLLEGRRFCCLVGPARQMSTGNRTTPGQISTCAFLFVQARGDKGPNLLAARKASCSCRVN
jgi:hypothetical protein